MTDKQKKIAGNVDIFCFCILLAIYTGLTAYLFWNQALLLPDAYPSDVKAYMQEMEGLDSGYSFPYPLFFRLGALFHLIFSKETAITLALVVLNSGSLIIMAYYVKALLQRDLELYVSGRPHPFRSMLMWKGGINLFVLSLFFVSMLFPVYYGMPGMLGKYQGVFSPNPHHNATYMATRPFAILAFFQFARILEEYEGGEGRSFDWRKGGLFGLSLLLTTLTKPSFTFVLVGTAGIIMAWRLLRRPGRAWGGTWRLAMCFIPTFAVLLYQFFGVFGPKEAEETGVGFGLFTAWSRVCPNIPLALALGLAFPVVSLTIHWRELKEDTLYRFSAQLLGMSILMLSLLYEKGFRLIHMNFSWGYMHGMFFAFTGGGLMMLKGILTGKEKWYLTVLELGAFLGHLLCGLIYFRHIWLGNNYL